MRVAVVNHHLRDVIGGSELQCDLVARGLTARGHDVTYLAVLPVGTAPPPPSDAGPGTTGPGRTGPGTTGPDASGGYAVVDAVGEPHRLAEAIVDAAPDVVYWRFNRRGLREVAGALRVAGIPLVVAIAHVDDVTRWPSWPWPARGASARDRASDVRSRVRWRRQLAAFGDVTAIASQRTDLIGTVPHATVALQRHVPNMMDPASVPFTWPRPYVAWVGNLKPRKRPELIPRIAAALAPHGIDLVVAGPAQDARYGWLTRPRSEHSGLHHVGTLGPAEVTGLLETSRCLAVTAMPEGFSNVMIQAWWGGTPTVTLDYDPDGVVAGEGLGAVAGGHGPADVDRFLAHVVRFATGADDEVAACGARAAAFARASFSGHAVLDSLEALLAEVTAGPSSGPSSETSGGPLSGPGGRGPGGVRPS